MYGLLTILLAAAGANLDNTSEQTNAHLTMPGETLMAEADPRCPIDTRDILQIMFRTQEDPTLRPVIEHNRVALELRCYEPADQNRPVYAVMISIETLSGARPPWNVRRIGALPPHPGQRSFLLRRVDVALTTALKRFAREKPPAEVESPAPREHREPAS